MTAVRTRRWSRPRVVALTAVTVAMLVGVTAGTVAASGAQGATRTSVPVAAPGGASARPQAPAWPVMPRQPMDARDLMGWVSRAEDVRRSAAVTVVTPTATVTGVRTWVDHVGLEADLRTVRGSGVTRAMLADGSVYVPLTHPVDGKHWVRSGPTGTDPALAPLEQLRIRLAVLVDPVGGWGGYQGRMPVTRGRAVTLDGVRTTPFSFRKNDQQLANDLWYDVLPATLHGATELTTYYVDAHGLPYRIVQVLTLKGQRPATTTTTFHRWGSRVTVPLPPPADVTLTLPASPSSP